MIAIPEGSTVNVDKDEHAGVEEVWFALKLVISCKREVKHFISQLFCRSLHKRSRLILKSVGYHSMVSVLSIHL